MALPDPGASEALSQSFITSETTDETAVPATEAATEGVSFMMAFFNLFNQLEGLGLLAVPYAFKSGGWVCLPLLVIVAFLSCMTGVMLATVLDPPANSLIEADQSIEDPSEESKTSQKAATSASGSYHSCAERAFGPVARIVVICSQLFGLLGIIVVYIVLIASAITGLTDRFSRVEATAIAFGISLPLVHINNLSYVAYLSVLAVLILAFTSVSVLTASVDHMRDYGVIEPDWSSGSTASGLGQAFGMLVFAFSAHSTFAEHRSSMQNTHQFPIVLSVTYVVLATWKAVFGVVAWLAYGDGTDELITNNLGSVVKGMSNCAIALNTWLSVPLVVVIFLRIFGTIRRSLPGKFRTAVERSVALALCSGIAAAVPHFALLLGLFGALSGTLLTFLFPAAFYLKLSHKDESWMSKAATTRALAWLILIFGTFAGGWSTVSATRELIDKM